MNEKNQIRLFRDPLDPRELSLSHTTTGSYANNETDQPRNKFMKNENQILGGDRTRDTITLVNLDEHIEQIMKRLAPHTILFAVAKVCAARAKLAKETRLNWPDCLLSGIWQGIASRIELLARDIMNGQTETDL